MRSGFASTDLVSERSDLVALHVCWFASPAPPPAPNRVCIAHFIPEPCPASTSISFASALQQTSTSWCRAATRGASIDLCMSARDEASGMGCAATPLESKTRALGLRSVPLALTHTDAFILALAQLQRARSQAQAILVGDPPMAMGAILFRSIEFGVIVSAKHLHLRQHPLRQHPLAAAPSRLELPPSGFLVPPPPAPPSPPRASQSSVFCVSQRCALCSG